MQKHDYMESVHIYGRIWTAGGILTMLMAPVAICVYYNAWPEMTHVLKGMLGVAPIFWTVGIIEVFTFTPMLGSGGSYLAFITGNLTNLKVPCALNAMEGVKAEAGTEAGEVISTIAVAVSAITTTLILSAGVLLLTALQPFLESETLAPAFDNILPALFGALGVVYISKNWRLAIAPLLFMTFLFLLMPGLSGSVGVLVPAGALIAIGVGRWLYKADKL